MNYRNQKYLDWIRQNRTCLVSGKKAEVAHHVRDNDNASGVGLKPSDYRVLPLLHSYHTTGSSAIHRIGPLSFYKKFKVDPLVVMVEQMKDYLLSIYDCRTVAPDSLRDDELLSFYENKIEELRPEQEKQRELKSIKKKKERTRQVNRKKREELKEEESFLKAQEEKKSYERMVYEKSKEFKPKQKVPKMSEEQKAKQREARKEYLKSVKERSKDQLDEMKRKQREFRKEQYKKLKELKKQWVSERNS